MEGSPVRKADNVPLKQTSSPLKSRKPSATPIPVKEMGLSLSPETQKYTLLLRFPKDVPTPFCGSTELK